MKNIPQNLVLRAKVGERPALEELIKLAYGAIWGYTCKYFAGRPVAGAGVNLAEEATQRTFIMVQGKLHSLKDPQAFRPWLYRIATNCCREEERRHRRRRVMPLAWMRSEEEAQTSYIPSLERGPHESLAQGELQELMKAALARLPENQRVVVILKEYEGLKFREIAEILKESENTVKSRLYYGLKALRKQMPVQEAYKLFLT